MAEVKKIGNRHCVVHGRTGAVLKRKGKRVCLPSRAAAQREANATRCRSMGRKNCTVGPFRR